VRRRQHPHDQLDAESERGDAEGAAPVGAVGAHVLDGQRHHQRQQRHLDKTRGG
jgi:hypothetical protein